MRKELTKRQKQFYDFIVESIKVRGYPPTIRDMMKQFGISSTNGVRSTLFAIEKKGFIKRNPFLSRGIELTDYIQRVPLEGVRDIPIVGKVAAGEPILAVENIEGTLAVDRSFVSSDGDNVFALTVQGDSMEDIGIFDGDYVLTRQQESADKGDIVVAIVGEEATVKRYQPEKFLIRLLSENRKKKYEPIVVNKNSRGFRIAGKVIGLMRKL